MHKLGGEHKLLASCEEKITDSQPHSSSSLRNEFVRVIHSMSLILIKSLCKFQASTLCGTVFC